VLLPATTVALAPPALADQTVSDQVCVAGSSATMSLERASVPVGDSTTLRTGLALSSSCSGTTLGLTGFSGTMAGGALAVPNTAVTPTASGTWTLKLTTPTGLTKNLASVTMTVTQVPPPPDPLQAGSTVTISTTGAASRDLFERAVVTPGATVHVAGNVNLDLSGVENLHVAPGVKIIGDRSVYPRGPRLFTTTFPYPLLAVSSDDVRISGLRIDGGAPADPDAAKNTPDAMAVEVISARHVEIDHDEIYGWRGMGIYESDPSGVVDSSTADLVRIHDDYVHDVQHPSGSDGHASGYGVVMYRGATALVDRNVFDRVRHSIAGDGRSGTGYLFRDNLILHPGADNTGTANSVDMHGTGCPADPTSYDCGPAGDYMDVAYNTFATTGTGIGLRGTPGDPRGMTVSDNVFAESPANALEQTETGLHDDGGNIFNSTVFSHATLSCDFDGDGAADVFAPTGTTWWYASTAANRWVYLRRSTATTGFALGDTNGDGRCDVAVGGSVYTTPGDFRSQVFVQAPSGAYTVVDADGSRGTQWQIAPRTSPAVVRLGAGGTETAFQSAADHTLWIVGPDGTGRGTGLTMQPGTSPAIATDGAGGWMAAAQASTGRLWTLGSADPLTQTSATMNTATTPAIAHLPTGGYEIAYVSAGNSLCVQAAGAAGSGGLNTGVTATTTPAIGIGGTGNWEVVVQNPGNQRMWSISRDAGPKDIGIAMAPGAIPAIAALSNGGFLIAYQGADGYLWKTGPTGGGAAWIGNGLGVASGTAPAIATDTGGRWQVAFHAQGDHLWTVDQSGVPSQADRDQPMADGTSPAAVGAHGP
jgi:hypothetical protein